ncbi:hypothetical protein MMC20_002186 [Loxospora ochrophaea]|nr:hypothetical protein [Loxospora ochrophaea]
MSSTPNYSLYSVLAFWAIAVAPHAYATHIAKSANNGVWSNANPRGAKLNEHLRKTIPAETFARYERAEAASKNGFENLPLFGIAIAFGNIAQLPASTLNAVAGGVVGLRMLYNFLYVGISDEKASFARSGVWFLTVGLCGYTIVSAGNKMM